MPVHFVYCPAFYAGFVCPFSRIVCGLTASISAGYYPALILIVHFGDIIVAISSYVLLVNGLGIGGLAFAWRSLPNCPSLHRSFDLASVTSSIVPNVIWVYPPCRPARELSMRV